MESKVLQLQLIDSTYSQDEAKEVLLQLINDKINFICGRIFSLEERFGADCTHLENRKVELKRAKEQLNELMAGLSDGDYDVQIDCPIHIKVVKKESGNNTVGELVES